jgi:hypothetical protein
MLILHRPFWYDEPGKPAKPRVVEPELGEVEFSHKLRFVSNPRSKKRVVLFGSTGYELTRGRSKHVRVMPQEQEAEYRDIEAQIAALKRRLDEVRDEAWLRANVLDVGSILKDSK